MEIAVANAQRTKRIDTRLLKTVVEWALAELHAEEGEISVRVVGAKEMARAHEEFMDIAGSTDVITFDHGSEPRRKLHGDILVCVDDAIEQAREFSTTWQEELARYTIHGLLHLSGFDDLAPAKRRVMKREEDRLTRGAAKKFVLGKLEKK